jgi:hypothetical protein
MPPAKSLKQFLKIISWVSKLQPPLVAAIISTLSFGDNGVSSHLGLGTTTLLRATATPDLLAKQRVSKTE